MLIIGNSNTCLFDTYYVAFNTITYSRYMSCFLEQDLNVEPKQLHIEFEYYIR